jgi:hypothetical protein
MYHKVGFDPKRDMEKVWKEHEILGRILIEPPQFVWSQLPSDAKIVREPSTARAGSD